MLDQLLKYHETPEPKEFTARVMMGIERQQRMRRLILASTGVVGAAFGVAGVMLLSDTITAFFTQVATGSNVVPMGITAFLVLGFLGWLFHDDPGLAG